MKRPTSEQIKEFWKWCGFKKVKHGKWQGWEWPDLGATSELPPIDLDNLFEHAVPKLDSFSLGERRYILLKWIEDVVSNKSDPALALFWAIWEVIKQ